MWRESGGAARSARGTDSGSRIVTGLHPLRVCFTAFNLTSYPLSCRGQIDIPLQDG